MKQHRSVFMLMTRSTVYYLLAILLAMTGLELALFFGMTQSQPSMEQAVGHTGMFGVFCLALIALYRVLGGVGAEKSTKLGYTIRRLQISERGVFLWQSVNNTLCFLVLWSVQVMVSFGLCLLYAAHNPGVLSPQSILLAFYRSSFLPGVMPLGELTGWMCTVLYIIALGIASAAAPICQRHESRGVSWIVPIVVILGARRPLGEGGKSWLVTIILALIAFFLCAGAMKMTYPEKN